MQPDFIAHRHGIEANRPLRAVIDRITLRDPLLTRRQMRARADSLYLELVSRPDTDMAPALAAVLRDLDALLVETAR